MLCNYLKTRSQVALGAELGVDQSAISAWARGTARPEPHFREALRRIALIPTEAWYSPDELAIAKGNAFASKKTGTDD